MIFAVPYLDDLPCRECLLLLLCLRRTRWLPLRLLRFSFLFRELLAFPLLLELDRELDLDSSELELDVDASSGRRCLLYRRAEWELELDVDLEVEVEALVDVDSSLSSRLPLLRFRTAALVRLILLCRLSFRLVLRLR